MKRADITNLFPDATDDQIKALMDINGADINSAKKNVSDLQTQLSEATATIEKLQAGVTGLEEAQNRANVYEAELTKLKAANTLREIREKVSKDTGVPTSLLSAETEEACRDQAASILEFAKPTGYPNVRDGGEAYVTGKKANRDLFADWLNKQGG